MDLAHLNTTTKNVPATAIVSWVTASKKPANRKEFKHSYLFKQLPLGMQRSVKGIFAGLKIIVGIVIDTSQSTECLTRSDKGMFNWNERTLDKIKSLNVKKKRFKLVLRMFTLFLNLILDITEYLLRENCFNKFMRSYNLLLKSNS